MLAGISGWLSSAQTAMTGASPQTLNGALTQLAAQVPSLPNGARLADDLHRLVSGRRKPSGGIRGVLKRIETALQRAQTAGMRAETTVGGVKPHARAKRLGGSGILTDAPPFLVEVEPTARPFISREDQAYIARRAVEHFKKSKRGIFRMDTGLGKSLTYGFVIRKLMKEMPEIFGDAVVVMGCHRGEPTDDLARQIKALFPDDNVARMSGDVKAESMKGVRFAIGTYQQLAQGKTVKLLKEWAGGRRVIFVNDEADMVVYKGVRVDDDDIPTGDWHACWFRTLIEFGLYNENGRYDNRTRHYRLGASATLDRPDGISLSGEWGAGNCFYHVPMASAIARGLMVPFLGKVVEMDVPPDAPEAKFDYFMRVTDEGRRVVDRGRVKEAAGSVYAIKTAVRAAVDQMLMKVENEDGTKALAVRQGIGFAETRQTLEKHMRWQQDLFALMEVIYHIKNGLAGPNPMRADAVLKRIGRNIENFGDELKRFLYSFEWTEIAPKFERVVGALKKNKMDGVAALFDDLYNILNVEARRLKGRPLVASAVWQDMGKDERGRKIQWNNQPLTSAEAAKRYPNRSWPNRFGDRAVTFQAIRDGEIDFFWSIDMADRGLNVPRVSSIVDNQRTRSRRKHVQKLGRAGRPPDGRNPTDHRKKPNAVVTAITENLDVHRLDLGRWDLARLFGNEMEPNINLIHVTPETVGKLQAWETPDKVQLELKDGRTVNLILVGANTANAVKKFLRHKYGDDYDEEVMAFDAGIRGGATELSRLLSAMRFPEKAKLRKWLKRWGAPADTTESIMKTFYSDLADMKTVYGGFWTVIREGGVA